MSHIIIYKILGVWKKWLMFYVLCFMFYVLCHVMAYFMSCHMSCHVICFMFYVLCFMFYVLCFMFYVMSCHISCHVICHVMSFCLSLYASHAGLLHKDLYLRQIKFVSCERDWMYVKDLSPTPLFRWKPFLRDDKILGRWRFWNLKNIK